MPEPGLDVVLRRAARFAAQYGKLVPAGSAEYKADFDKWCEEHPITSDPETP